MCVGELCQAVQRSKGGARAMRHNTRGELTRPNISEMLRIPLAAVDLSAFLSAFFLPVEEPDLDASAFFWLAEPGGV